MLFSEMEFGFQKAFLSAWRAYKRGNMPIGCAIVTSHNELVSTGENSIYADDGGEIVVNHRLAHAELNAILKLDAAAHPDLSSYVLYTTLEPCPLCFGAILQGTIRRVRFAASDEFDGASCLNTSPIPYVRDQKIEFSGPEPALQALQIALIVYRRLKFSFTHNSAFFEMYREYCPEGLEIGGALFNDTVFTEMDRNNGNPAELYDYILQKFPA